MNEKDYILKIKNLKNPTFQQIRHIADESISHLSKKERDKLYDSLNRGINLLNTHEQMCQYLWSFGNMHERKIHYVVNKLPPELFQREYDIVDWGCGQGIATICFFDYLKEKGLSLNVKNVKLVEPGNKALKRAKLHIEQYISKNNIQTINKYFEQVDIDEIKTERKPVIHFFSNILDIQEINLKELAEKLNSSLTTDNYIVTVGPINATNKRIDWFFQYFKNSQILLDEENTQFRINNYSVKTLKAKVYKLEYNEEGNIIPIEFYPSVQFHSAYQLDIVNEQIKLLDEKYKKHLKALTSFELSAPFDIGAYVYDDIHPVYAVLNNIITRGLPTKSSIYIEDFFEKNYSFSKKTIEYGTIKYKSVKKIDLSKIINKNFDTQNISEKEKQEYEIIYSPILIARIQKTIIEALLTKKLTLKNTWKILIEEKDIPAGKIALEDLKILFNNLTELTKLYKDLKFPKIELTIVNNSIFRNSKLHNNHKIINETNNEILKTKFDLVITTSIFSKNDENDNFGKYLVDNDCYFNINSSSTIRSERKIYTTDRINYRKIVKYDNYGKITNYKKAEILLTFFLKLIFRKEEFRQGQLPILNRALQNKSVIGLLPTGGGKSLTYQLSAMLQPGVTIIIDPLKSLMKDQYDGLINYGIDNCDFINSSLNHKQRKVVEDKLEKSQLLFIFLSPERLAIYNFRERLKNMQKLNVYFSYGVVDETHCVSEWGHDFRFSYLHLGRNLYNYVKAKNGYISLFGLTATASFDVLADVERELSGNGAFPLDAETVVRHENTNRLELQYKIEKINVDFKTDDFFKPKKEHYNQILPKPVKIADKWKFYDQKKEFLYEYIKKTPQYIRDLQTEENIKFIKKEFIERINLQDEKEKAKINDADLSINMPDNFYEKDETYEQAGIVFCPHKNGTGISVNKNVASLRNYIDEVGKFYGGNDNENFEKELEYFRDNKKPLMIATKAFGMGIDKPNVRFTINLNYSSSLESFVQEAGRAGRDRKMALSVIFISDYTLKRISRKYPSNITPLNVIKGKWFKPDDLKKILNHYNLIIDDDFIDTLNPQKDLVRITCSEGTTKKYFGFNQCTDNNCPIYNNCVLRTKLPSEAENWQYEKDLIEILEKNKIHKILPKKHFEYQNADYDTVMYFYNNNFKGPVIEKKHMVNILNELPIKMFFGNKTENSNDFIEVSGFLETLSNADIKTEVVSFIPYDETNYPDIAKAIYRMTSIGLIEDFTQDYRNSHFRIVSTRHHNGYYYTQLKIYLERYYTSERAEIEVNKAKYIRIKETNSELKNEIYRCLAYLTDFVYDKISVKRKRAIDDMRNFCVTGIEEGKDWKIINEELKDYIYYYFNSKYAQSDYVAENEEPYSLTEDTEKGKKSSSYILFKYLKVTDAEIVGTGTEIDNVKHLQGAVKLIRRSLTDDNPTISLLNAFCLSFLGTRNNENLELELKNSYMEGLIGFYERLNEKSKFWNEIFHPYNDIVSQYIPAEQLNEWSKEIEIRIHLNEFNNITKKYLS